MPRLLVPPRRRDLRPPPARPQNLGRGDLPEINGPFTTSVREGPGGGQSALDAPAHVPAGQLSPNAPPARRHFSWITTELSRQTESVRSSPNVYRPPDTKSSPDSNRIGLM